MIVYIANLAIVVVCAYFARRTHSVHLSRILLGVAFISMVLVGGLRNRSVGTDSGTYVSMFDRITTLEEVQIFSERMWEHGFWALTWLIHFISDNYVAFFLAIAIICVGCYQWVIVSYSALIEVSFFVFIANDIYAFFFNGARQAIACAIFALAIGPMLRKNFKLYLTLIVIAFLFHKTAIMMIPVYFIVNRTNSFKVNLTMILIGATLALTYDRLLSAVAEVDTRYIAAGATGAGGGYVLVAYTVVLSAFFFFFRNAVSVGRDQYDRFLNMFFFGTMIGVVSSLLSVNPSGTLRYSLYFNIATAFLWPIVFVNIRTRLWKFIIGYVFFLGYMVFFVLTTRAWSNLLPYTFNRTL